MVSCNSGGKYSCRSVKVAADLVYGTNVLLPSAGWIFHHRGVGGGIEVGIEIRAGPHLTQLPEAGSPGFTSRLPDNGWLSGIAQRYHFFPVCTGSLPGPTLEGADEGAGLGETQ